MAITPTIIDKQYNRIWGFDPRTIPTCNLWIDTSTNSTDDISDYGNKVVQSGSVTYNTSPNGLKYANLSSRYLTLGSTSSTINSDSFGITGITCIRNNTLNPAINNTYITPSSLTRIPAKFTTATGNLINLAGTANWKDSTGIFSRYTLTNIPENPTQCSGLTLTVNPIGSIITSTQSISSFNNNDNITFSASTTTLSASIDLNSVAIGSKVTYNLVTPATPIYSKNMYVTISEYTDSFNNGIFAITDLVPYSRRLTIIAFTNTLDFDNDLCVFTFTGTAPTDGTKIILNDDFGNIPSNNYENGPTYYYIQYPNVSNKFYLAGNPSGGGTLGNVGGSTNLPPNNTASYDDASFISGFVVDKFFQEVNVPRAFPSSIMNVSILGSKARYTLNNNPLDYGYGVDDVITLSGVSGTTTQAITAITGSQSYVTVTVGSNVGFAAGAVVSIQNVTSKTTWNGSYSIYNLIGTTQFRYYLAGATGSGIVASSPTATAGINNATNAITAINTSDYPPYYIEVTKTTQISTTQIPIRSVAIGTDVTNPTILYRTGVVCASASNTATVITYNFNVNLKLYGYKVGTSISTVGFNPTTYNVSGSIASISSNGKTITFAKTMTAGTATPGILNYNLYFTLLTANTSRITVTGCTNDVNNVREQMITSLAAGGLNVSSTITVTMPTGVTGVAEAITYSFKDITPATLSPADGKLIITVTGTTGFVIGNSVLIDITSGTTTFSGVYKIVDISYNTFTILTTETGDIVINAGTVSTQWNGSASSHGVGGLTTLATPDTGSVKDTGILANTLYSKFSIYDGLGNESANTFNISADGTNIYPLLAQSFPALPSTVTITSNNVIADSNIIAKTTRIKNNYVYVDNIDWIQRGSTSVYFTTDSSPIVRDTTYNVITVLSTPDPIYKDYGIQINTSGAVLTDNTSYISDVYFAAVVGIYYSFTSTNLVKYYYPTGSVGMVQTDKNIVNVTTIDSIDTTLSKMVTIGGIGSYTSPLLIHLSSSGYNGNYKLLSTESSSPNTFNINSNLSGVPIYPTTTSVQSAQNVTAVTFTESTTFTAVDTLTLTITSTAYFVPGSMVYLYNTTSGGYYLVTDILSSTQFKVLSNYSFIPTSVILQVPYAQIGLDIGINDFSIFAVVEIPPRPSSGTSTYYIITKNSSSTPCWELYLISSSTSSTLYFSYTPASSSYSASVTTTLTGWVVVSAIANRTTGSRIYVNGTVGGVVGTIEEAPRTLTSNGNTYIGTNSTNASPWNSGIGEILMYNSTIDTTRQQVIEGYLAWKWGLQNSLDSGHNWYGLRSNPTGLTPPTSPFSQLLAPTDIPNCKIWLDGGDNTSIYVSPTSKLIPIEVSANSIVTTIYFLSVAELLPSGFGIGNTLMVTNTNTIADGHVFTVSGIDYGITYTYITTNSIGAFSSSGYYVGEITFSYAEFPLTTSVYAWNDKSGNGNTAWQYSTATLPIYTYGSGVKFALTSRTGSSLKSLSNSAVLQTKFSSGNAYETGFIVFNVDHYSNRSPITYASTSLSLGDDTYLIGSTINSPFTTKVQSRAVILHQHNANALADETAFGIIVTEQYTGNVGKKGQTYVSTLNSQGPCSDLLRVNKTYILSYTTAYTNDYTFCEYLNGLGLPLAPNSKPFEGGTTSANTLLGPQYQGKILEYIAYTGTSATTIISDIDRQRVEGYLSKKWNVPLISGHPFATIPTGTAVPY